MEGGRKNNNTAWSVSSQFGKAEMIRHGRVFVRKRTAEKRLRLPDPPSRSRTKRKRKTAFFFVCTYRTPMVVGNQLKIIKQPKICLILSFFPHRARTSGRYRINIKYKGVNKLIQSSHYSVDK